jgi:UDP-N-acetylmuramate--alanine ligase
MIAAAGTHGKTTTTAMLIWTLKNLGVPISYSVGAKTSFADMGLYDSRSRFFVYECDEFHRNFLHFKPTLSVISGISWDHHEVFPTREDYKSAFREFIEQTSSTILWDTDAQYINLHEDASTNIIDSGAPGIQDITLPGLYNRRNAWLVVEAVHRLVGAPKQDIVNILNSFPGTSRRMEEVSPGIFSDYAHTPEKIVGCMSMASDIAQKRNKDIVVVYEPLTNRRQHYMKNDYKSCFAGTKTVYWVPSYLAREDPKQVILRPEDLIMHLDDPTIAQPANLDDELWGHILDSLERSIVVCMSGGGGGSLDEWLRGRVQNQSARRG